MAESGRERADEIIERRRRFEETAVQLQRMDAHLKGFLKADTGKLPAAILPVDALAEVARVMQVGKEKYGRDNWAQGADWTRYLDAMQRHIWAFQAGEDNDPETGLSHMGHAACNALFLTAYALRQIGCDDRPWSVVRNFDGIDPQLAARLRAAREDAA
ncbi:MAG: dATP/dGTP diphosphohydrolase domain-containing protein [Pseudomonadota bacterium]